MVAIWLDRTGSLGFNAFIALTFLVMPSALSVAGVSLATLVVTYLARTVRQRRRQQRSAPAGRNTQCGERALLWFLFGSALAQGVTALFFGSGAIFLVMLPLHLAVASLYARRELDRLWTNGVLVVLVLLNGAQATVLAFFLLSTPVDNYGELNLLFVGLFFAALALAFVVGAALLSASEGSS